MLVWRRDFGPVDSLADAGERGLKSPLQKQLKEIYTDYTAFMGKGD